MFSIRSVPTASTARATRRKKDAGNAPVNRLIFCIFLFLQCFSYWLIFKPQFVLFPARSSVSKRGDVTVLHLELDGDLPEPATHRHDFVEFWIKIVLQHRGPGMFQVVIE